VGAAEAVGEAQGVPTLTAGLGHRCSSAAPVAASGNLVQTSRPCLALGWGGRRQINTEGPIAISVALQGRLRNPRVP
jgi:hypothetical protein